MKNNKLLNLVVSSFLINLIALYFQEFFGSNNIIVISIGASIGAVVSHFLFSEKGKKIVLLIKYIYIVIISSLTIYGLHEDKEFFGINPSIFSYILLLIVSVFYLFPLLHIIIHVPKKDESPFIAIYMNMFYTIIVLSIKYIYNFNVNWNNGITLEWISTSLPIASILYFLYYVLSLNK